MKINAERAIHCEYVMRYGPTHTVLMLDAEDTSRRQA
jgi:hypothetical protein